MVYEKRRYRLEADAARSVLFFHETWAAFNLEDIGEPLDVDSENRISSDSETVASLSTVPSSILSE